MQCWTIFLASGMLQAELYPALHWPTAVPATVQQINNSSAASDRPGLVPPLTLDRFDQAARIAKLAAENKMHALSLRAIAEATRGGPPITARPDGTRFGSAQSRTMAVNPNVGVEDQSIARQVEARIFELDTLWKRHEAPPKDVYQALANLVLPDARPAEVFLYPIPLAEASRMSVIPGSGSPQPRSVGAILVRWAVAADAGDDLRQRIAARQDGPLAQLPARVLLAQLAQASKNVAESNATLQWLGDWLQKDTLLNTAELACHAALPALLVANTRDAAMPIVERAAKNMAGQPNAVEEPAASMLIALARLQFDRQNAEEGKKYLEEFIRVIERSGARYGGDYGPYRRKLGAQRVGIEYARAGLLEPALEMFGQFADAPTTRYGETGPGALVGLVARLLAARPAPERYETLRQWTMPTDTRKSVRLASSFASVDSPPSIFAGWLGSSLRAPSPSTDGPSIAGGSKKRPQPPAASPSGFVSSATVLIDAARESAKLDELADELKKAADEKVENARHLFALVQIARGRPEEVEPLLKEIADELPKRIPLQNDQQRRIEWPDYLVARACLFEPRLRTLGDQMTTQLVIHAQRTQDFPFLSHLRDDQCIALVTGGREPAPSREAGLALWDAAAHQTAATHRAGAVPACWVEHEGHISHITGPEQQFLFLSYPLTGTFEFSVEGWTGGWAESHLAYGGLGFEVMGWNSAGTIWPVGRSETIARPCRFIRNEAFNRFTIQVAPGQVRCLVNGHLFYEDSDPSPTSPWLALFTGRERRTAWRNLKITGKPEIPREVALTAGDRMEGWISGFYHESQPPRRSVRKAGGSGPIADPAKADSVVNLDDFDWAARDGLIYGRRSVAAAQVDAQQSRLYYHRPLQNGESIRYEFYYEPDSVVVHPALDRLTFLLEPDGVRLHWMSDGLDDDSGLKTDNVADEPSIRRGPAKLPLKPGEWNMLKLSLGTNAAMLELNGVEIFEREMEPTNDRLFGFFHYKDRSASRVRNVVLSGNWPEQLTAEQLADLTARSNDTPGIAAPHARHGLIGEHFYWSNAESILRHARTLPLDERYSFLADWVLPGEGHNALRMYGYFTPTEPAPPVAATAGGTLEAPGIELVNVAKQLGKLDEFADRVRAAQPADWEPYKRGKLALECLIRIAQERDDEAAALLGQMKEMLPSVAKDNPEWVRLPDLIVASAGMNRPALRSACRALIEYIVVEQFQKEHHNFSEAFRRHVYHVSAIGHWLALAEADRAPFGTAPKLKYWTPHSNAQASTRGTGMPIAHWHFAGGELRHFMGHDHDWVYFRVPLRGNFEVTCEPFGWREVQLAYGGRLLGLGWGHTDYYISHLGRNPRRVEPAPKLEGVDYSYQYRLAVRDGNYEAYVNGRKIHEERLPANPDPWLVLAQPAAYFGGVKNLKITGEPTVPDQIELSALPDLTGWLADYYEESTSGDNRAWEKRGEEIFGRQFTDAPGSKQESVLQYHRPLLEDGEIEYEFFYEPGRSTTHPALDRLTFLLEPAGVRVHWMTDGKYDRTGLAPDNATDEPSNRRGPAELPLKSHEWNRVKLAIATDTITLRLNDELIYERELETTNHRNFGLFHYADETEVRVRNATYRGQWPRDPISPGLWLGSSDQSTR